MHGGGEHVLYVDDDEVMLLMVESLLQRSGYRVTACQDARAALTAVRAQPADFDLVVTDLNMPDLSGLDVARELGRIRADLPVVISSGFITEAMRAEAQRAGVRGLPQKENTIDELPALVRSMLAPAKA